MGKKKAKPPAVRQFEILDPPAYSVVGKSFSVSGTCNAGNGVLVEVTCVDSQGHATSGTCAIQDDNWSVPITVDCTGQLQSLAASVQGGGGTSLAGVTVEESGILTLSDDTWIGTEFTATGLCEILATDPSYVPRVELIVHLTGGGGDQTIYPTDITTNPSECSWEAYFSNVPHPNLGCDLTMTCGTYNHYRRHIVSRLRTTRAVENTSSSPSHGAVFRAPSDPTARAKGNAGNNARRWAFITRGGHKIFRHVQTRPNNAGEYDQSLQEFYPTGGVELDKAYGFLIRTKLGNGNLVQHSRGFHYFRP